MKLFFFIIFIFNSIVYGLGLSTDFNNIFIENLAIGQEYNLTKDFGVPFKAIYSGDRKVVIKLEPVYPAGLKPGFELIPEIKWIKLSKEEILVNSGKEIFTDVKIKIPHDKKLLGRQFQVNIRCYISSVEEGGMVTFTPGVEGVLLFSISKELKRKKFKPVDLNFELEPKEVLKKIKLSEKDNFVEKVNIKNLSKKEYNFVIAEKNPFDVNVVPKEGYQLLPKDLLLLSVKELKIKGKQSKSVHINLSKENLSAGKYFGLLEVVVSTKELVKSRYVKVYLEIEK